MYPQRASDLNESPPVLIAGAGPTGLTLAHCLAAHGVPFRIIDRKLGPTRDSKALVINVLSQYQFALIGQAQALGAGATRLVRANVFCGEDRLNALDFRRLDFPLRSFISQPQAATEQQLINALPEHVGVDWQTQLLDVSEQADGVTTRMKLADGREQVERYEFVVGCEGKTSLVRDAIGAEWEGWDYPMHFLLGDFELSWTRAGDQAYYFVFDETFFVVVPIGGGLWRVVVKRDGPLPQPSGAESSVLTGLVARYFGPTLIQGPPRWFSAAPFYMRIATRLQTARLLLAGDSAHLFSPIGGTGMNTGMQDAFNLGWKLAYVVKGYATAAALLPSYTEERLPAIRQGAAATDTATRLIAGLERAPERIAPMLPSLRRRSLLRLLPIKQAGLDLQYGTSGAIQDNARETRIPAGSLCRALIDPRPGPHASPAVLSCQICVFLTSRSQRAHARELASLARDVSAFGDRPLTLRTILLDEQPSPGNLRTTDATTQLRGMGATDGDLLVVRPDGIVAFSGSISERQDLAALLSRWFGRPRAEAQAKAPVRTVD